MLDNIKIDIPTKEIYNDAFSPAVKAVGTLVSIPPRTVHALLAPLEKWLLVREHNLEKISESVLEKLQAVDKSKIIQPEPYVAVPALQAISYCMDNDELRDLYANLLAKVMNTDTAKEVHPAFTEIIKQLSPLDALLLKDNIVASLPLCDLRVQKKSSPSTHLGQLLPAETRLFKEGLTLYENLSCLKVDGYSEENITTAIENLARLGLYTITKYALSNADYSIFADCETFKKVKYDVEQLKNTSDKNLTPEVFSFYQSSEFASIRKSTNITNLGKSFIEICVL